MERIPDHPMIRRLEAAGTIYGGDPGGPGPFSPAGTVRGGGLGRAAPFALTRASQRTRWEPPVRGASPAAAERPG